MLTLLSPSWRLAANGTRSHLGAQTGKHQQYVLYIFIATIYHYGERFIVNGHDQLALSSQLFAQGRRLLP